jgi:hypothetical protein
MKSLGRISLLACLASFSAIPSVRAMSADSSAYAIVLPFVLSTPFYNSQIFVENHSSGPVDLLAYYVGESQSINPLLLKCSESNASPAAQTFILAVPPDGVLQFDLRALLAQKCKGFTATPPGGAGDRGALTIFTLKGGEATRISAFARVERVAGAGTPGFGFGEPGLPIGALEGSTQIITGAQNGTLGAATVRTDCMVTSLFDAGGAGNLYRVTVKSSPGQPLGSKVFFLAPWSAELLSDVFALVGAGGTSIDGAMVEVEPAANSTSPSMVAACRVIDVNLLTTTYLMGKVYEPKDLLRQRRVNASETPGVGRFLFDPGTGMPSLHAVFLRHPDLVECVVDSPRLALTVRAPDGTFISGGFQSTGEFDTRPRGAINNGYAGAWRIAVTANQANPPTGQVPYTLTCVSGNGMSQLDRMPCCP